MASIWTRGWLDTDGRIRNRLIIRRSITVKTLYRMMGLGMGVLLFTGCATWQLISAVVDHGYEGNWLTVDMTKTNAPSGAHLLNLLVNDSSKVKSLVSQYGTPDYLRYGNEKEKSSDISFVFLKDNTFVALSA